MAHQQMQRPVPYAEKQLGTLEYKLCNTPEEEAQQVWADWWENGVYQQPKPKRMFIGSGEDVCLSEV